MQQVAGRHPAMNGTHCIAFFILQFTDSADISGQENETVMTSVSKTLPYVILQR